jgi:signal transduction histidine kinase
MPDECPPPSRVVSPPMARSPGHPRTGIALEYLRAIGDVAQATVDREDPSEVFRRIAVDARTLVGAASSTIGTLEPDRTSLRIRAASGARAEMLQVGAAVPVEGTLASGVVRTGQPLVVGGAEDAPEPYRSVLVRFGLGPAMCMPLVTSGRVFGAMAVAHAPGHPPFRAADVALVEAFAHQAAIALEFARVRDELRRLAVLDERERIARELHDGAIQGLFGLGLDLQGLAARPEVAAFAPRLEAAVIQIDDVIQDLRRYIAGLRPGILSRPIEPASERAGELAGSHVVRNTPMLTSIAPSSPQRAHTSPRSGRGLEHRLRAIGDITQAILEGDDVDTVFARLAHSARSLVDAESALVGTLRGKDSNTLVLRAIEGPQAERFRPGDLFRVEDTVLAEAVQRGEPFVVADVEHASSGSFDRSRQLGIGAAIAVPLAVRGRVFGALALGWGAGRPAFPAADVRLVATFAAQAAIGLEYGRARDELHRLAVLSERERIARELHEGVIQTLFGAGMDLQALATAVEDQPTSRRLAQAVDGIDTVIRDLRNYVFGLRPGILADRQLDRALRDLASDFAQRTGITPSVDIDADVAARLGGAAASDVVQLAREALSNVARHAQAGACRLALHHQAGHAVLEVADDGRGMVAGEVPSTGQGLSNMQARAGALGGVLLLDHGLAGRGLALRVLVPL